MACVSRSDIRVLWLVCLCACVRICVFLLSCRCLCKLVVNTVSSSSYSCVLRQALSLTLELIKSVRLAGWQLSRILLSLCPQHQSFRCAALCLVFTWMLWIWTQIPRPALLVFAAEPSGSIPSTFFFCLRFVGESTISLGKGALILLCSHSLSIY